MSIEYRPMTIEDASQAGLILADVWHSDVSGELAHLHGIIDLANIALRHTYSQVAVIDGKVEGLVLARAGMPSDEDVAEWRELRERSYAQANAVDKRATDELRGYAALEQKIDQGLLAESGCNPNYELVLFIVSQKTRGRGVGSKLLSGAKQYLAQTGGAKAFLFTDTCCTWEYYERRGMARKAQRENPPASGMPRGMFLYEFDIKQA